jgi:HTH-type transcriptional regulator / antitoxin HigA
MNAQDGGLRLRLQPALRTIVALTVEMIHRINEAWKIPADLLVKPSRVAT